jgi:hypothetical protein
MSNRIIISESQYSRLFLNEQQPILLGVNKEFDSYGKYNIVNQNPILTEQRNWWGILKAEFGISPTTQMKNGVVSVAKKLHPDTAVPEIEKGFQEIWGKFDENTINDLGKGSEELAKEVYDQIISPTYEYVKEVDLQKSAVEFSNWLEKNVGRAIEDFGESVFDQLKDAYYVLGRDLKKGSITKQGKDGAKAIIQKLNPEIAGQQLVDGVNELVEKFDEDTADKLLVGLGMLGDNIKKEIVDPVVDFVVDCSKDIHCILDVASVVSLAIPGIGLAVSAGLDFVNALSYSYEVYNAETSEDKYAAILAGGLTMFGGIFGGGIKQTNRILKYGSKNPKIYNYASDVLSAVKKEFPGVKNIKSVKNNQKLTNIYGEVARKHKLTDNEILLSHDLLDNFSKIDPAIAKQYTNALTALENKIQKGNLVLLGKDKGLKTAIDASGGDIVIGLKKYMGKVARKEAVMEASLFVLVSEAMEQPSVQKWMGEKYSMLKYSGREDIRGLVEKEGYDWENTKEIFMSISTKNPDGSKNDGYSDKQSEQDNSLLKKAWEKGWRPELGRDWLIKNPKYQTKTFKNLLSKPKRIAALRSDDPDFVEKEGVVYLDNEDDVWLTNAQDDDVTYGDTEKSQSILDELLGL